MRDTPRKRNQGTKAREELALIRESLRRVFSSSIPLFKIRNKTQTLHKFGQCICTTLSEGDVWILRLGPEQHEGTLTRRQADAAPPAAVSLHLP